MRLRFLAVAIAAAFALPASGDVRPISAMEREAVQIAAEYLELGPRKIVERLARSSPLLKSADPAAEVEVRLGPTAGATWKLQTVVPALRDQAAVFTIVYPSGIDETVTFEFDPVTKAIRDIRILAQRSKRAALFPAVDAASAANVAVMSLPRRVAIGAGIIALGAALAAMLLVRRERRASRALLIIAVVVVGGAATYAIPRDEHLFERYEVQAPRKRAHEEPSLASLLPLRRAMAGSGDADHAFLTRPRRGALGDIARLWEAQVDLQQTRMGEVKRAIAATRNPSEIPLAAILRARVALHENDDATAVMAYEQAVSLGPGRDGLWYEAAEALMALGFDERASKYLRRLEKIGSRDADVYYSLALLDASKRREEQAVRALRTAWSLRPVPREEILEMTPFWPLLREGEGAKFLDLSNPDDEAVPPTCGAGDRGPSRLPSMRIAGNHLLIRPHAGDDRAADIIVPGGACIADIYYPPSVAAVWQRAEEERALRDLPKLVPLAQRESAFAQPALRQRIARVAEALANRNRWLDVAQLTDRLTPRMEHVPAELFFHRDTALRRLGRNEESKALLVELAASKVLQRKNDAQALEILAEKLASHDYFDLAIKLYDRAQTIRENPYTDDRVRQLQMNKRLATKYSKLSTPSFDVHYPDDVSPVSAGTIGEILESEHRRLWRYLGNGLKQRLVVNVVWWRDFRSTYTGNDFILGFYSGKITVPFAGLTEFRPELIAILSHELMHAMIAQATNDQAPRWFQEGLAQRIEVKSHTTNPYRVLPPEKLIAMPLVDTTMRNSPYPADIMNAYAQSEMAVHFIESRHGVDGVKKMIEAFRDGATTDDALKKVTGLDFAAFDHQLRSWAKWTWAVNAAPADATGRVLDGSQIRWSRRTQ